MRKIILLSALLLAACGPGLRSIQPTAAINQFPTLMPTPTLAVNTRPIGDEEMEEALNFFYELKNLVALAEYEHFAEEIRYPITVRVDGKPKTYTFVAEFEADFEKILSEDHIQRFISTDESELTFTPEGVKVADGILWFGLICLDPACNETEFLITEINNSSE